LDHAYGTAGSYRDVDVRMMLDEEQFAAVCPDRARWELLCLAIGAYLAERTGLLVDFQIQRTTEANERFHGPRNRSAWAGSSLAAATARLTGRAAVGIALFILTPAGACRLAATSSHHPLRATWGPPVRLESG
jgi:hypothetical protein